MNAAVWVLLAAVLLQLAAWCDLASHLPRVINILIVLHAMTYTAPSFSEFAAQAVAVVRRGAGSVCDCAALPPAAAAAARRLSCRAFY